MLRGNLPNHNNDEVQNIPAISKIGTRVKHEAKGHYLKQRLDTEYPHKIIFCVFLQQNNKDSRVKHELLDTRKPYVFKRR